MKHLSYTTGSKTKVAPSDYIAVFLYPLFMQCARIIGALRCSLWRCAVSVSPALSLAVETPPFFFENGTQSKIQGGHHA